MHILKFNSTQALVVEAILPESVAVWLALVTLATTQRTVYVTGQYRYQLDGS